MSALKHGFFRAGFMLCDHFVWTAECKHFKPVGQCWLEREAFRKVVSELMEEFELDSVADRILVERAGMYLIRIARAEVYEAAVGVTEKSALWGAYISRLDNTLRGLFNDLARAQQRKPPVTWNTPQLLQQLSLQHGNSRIRLTSSPSSMIKSCQETANRT